MSMFRKRELLTILTLLQCYNLLSIHYFFSTIVGALKEIYSSDGIRGKNISEPYKQIESDYPLWCRIFHWSRSGFITKLCQAGGILFIGFSEMGMENCLHSFRKLHFQRCS